MSTDNSPEHTNPTCFRIAQRVRLADPAFAVGMGDGWDAWLSKHEMFYGDAMDRLLDQGTDPMLAEETAWAGTCELVDAALGVDSDARADADEVPS